MRTASSELGFEFQSRTGLSFLICIVRRIWNSASACALVLSKSVLLFIHSSRAPTMGDIPNKISVLSNNSFFHFYYSTSIFHSINASGYQEVIDLIPFHAKKKNLTH